MSVKPAVKSPDTTELAKMALAMMATHGVSPTPEHYAVWYYYCQGSKRELVAEINQTLQNKRRIDDAYCDYLNSRYLAENIDHQVVEQARQDAKALMEHAISLMEGVTKSTHGYNRDMDKAVTDLKGRLHVKELRDVADAIIGKTQELQSHSQNLSSRLEASSREVQALRRDLEKITAEAKKDFLTSVDNRKAFDARLDEMMAAARREKQDFCLLMVDIDHFKSFNDKHGHMVGDEVLKGVARVLVECVRGKDVVARFGGEEFAILLPATPLAGGLAVAEHLRKAVAGKHFIRKDTGKQLEDVTISIGVGAFKPDDTANSLVTRTDDALYRSKKGGRNKVTQESMK
jgi:diguanylate cyclase